MKNGWEIKPLQALCDNVKQDIVDGPFGSELQRKDYVTNGIPVLKIQNIKPFAIELKKMDYVSPAKYDELKRHSYQQGDIVMTKLGNPLGVSAIVKGIDDGIFVADLVRIRAQRINTKYLCYQLNSQQTNDYINSLQKGTTRPRVTLSVVRELPIVVPPLPEQQRIVAILDEAFAGIATARANTEKNLQNARALFESQLQAVFTRKADEVPLSEVAIDITDGDHSPPPKALTGVPFITISNIMKQTREIDFSNTFKVPEAYYKNLKPNKRPKFGDVLYTVTGATLGIPVLVKEERDFCFQRHIGLIRPKPDTDSVWLSYALLSPQVFRQATNGSTGAAQKTVSLSVLRNIKVPKIRLSDQRIIASHLDKLYAETQHLESIYQQKLNVLDESKKSLLHQAFTGEL